MQILKDKLSSISGGRVLDVGTGRGYFIYSLKECFKDYTEMIGIDSCSDEKLQPARDSFKEDSKVKFMSMDAENLSFEDNSFDTVCISNTIHHLSNIDRVLGEMKRVLKPGGLFIINEMYKDNQTEAQLTHVYMHHWWGAIDTASGVVHNETFDRQEIIDIVNKLQLRNIEAMDFSDLSSDPFDPETVKEIETSVDRCIERSKTLPTAEALIKTGETHREYFHKYGWHSATQAIIIGIK